MSKFKCDFKISVPNRIYFFPLSFRNEATSLIGGVSADEYFNMNFVIHR